MLLFLDHNDELCDRTHDKGRLSPSSMSRTKLKPHVSRWNCGVAIVIRESDSFPTLADFLHTAGEDMDGNTVAFFKQHLQDLHSELGIYFPEIHLGTKRTLSKSVPCVHQERLKALWTFHQMGH